MEQTTFPTIDMAATGRRIKEIREQRGITVKELQEYLGFNTPVAIYKWQRGESLPSIDNAYAMSYFFRVSMNELLVDNHRELFLLVFYSHFTNCLEAVYISFAKFLCFYFTLKVRIGGNGMRTVDHKALSEYVLKKMGTGMPVHMRLAFVFGSVEPDLNVCTYLRGSVKHEPLRGHNYGSMQEYMYKLADRLDRGGIGGWQRLG